MDNLVKQRKRRVSISEKKQSDFSISELDITDYPALNWLKNQSYWYEKNDYYNEKESEFAVSVAAAASVIRSIEEVDKQEAKRRRDEIKKLRTKKTNPAVTNTKEKRLSKSYTQEVKIGEESFKKKSLEYQPENGRAKEMDSSSKTLGLALTPSKVDSWENTQIKKIRLRYEKLKAEIVGWENERKLAANLRMEKRKSELEKRKDINNQHYKSKLARIQLIADGAKKQLEEKRRNKEAQVHEKVKKMHRTGKVPKNYFCLRCY